MSFSGILDDGADWISENGVPTNLYIGWGSTTSTLTRASTDLTHEETEDRVTCTVSTATDCTWTISGTMTADSAKTITEFGVYTALTGGTLLAAATLSQEMDLSDTYTFNVTIPFIN
jgi:hypothetical protein